jgi:cytochrome P450
VTDYVFPPPPELAMSPFEAYARLRDERPVYRAPGGEFVVSRYEDVVSVYRQDEVFPSRDRIGHPIKNLAEVPEHMERRLLLTRSMAPRRLKRYEKMGHAFANQLIDGFPEEGEFDVVADFGLPFATYAICGILGLDLGDYDRLLAWGRGFEGGANAYIGEERHLSSLDRWSQLHSYALERIEERIAQPRDDLLTELIEVRRNATGTIDFDVMMSDVAALLSAGLHTTANTIGFALKLMLENGWVDRARDDRSVIPTCFEETLRHQSPVQWNKRVAARDAEIAGVPVPAGSVVILLVAAANRDDSMFDRPDEFDPARGNLLRHLGFGSGVHFCLGAPLARLEGRIALETLLDRLDRIRVVSYVIGDHVELRQAEQLRIAYVKRDRPAAAVAPEAVAAEAAG